MKVILIGHTIGIKRCIEEVNSSNHEIVAVFTHERKLHGPDLQLFDTRKEHFIDYSWDVFNTEREFQIPLFEYISLDDSATVDLMNKLQADVLVAVGCRDILKPSLIERFRFAINLHPFNLPFFRGAGIDSWMILMGAEKQQQQATCHFITKGIDKGDVICTAPYQVLPSDRPIDVFKRRIDLLGNLLLQALNNIESPDFKATRQDDSMSSYFPRLNTLRDGKIDFINWSGDEIARFIRAFSYPYHGAWAYYNEQQLHILDAAFTQIDNVHPFSYGLAFRKISNELFVYVKNGMISITAIEFKSKSLPIYSIKLGRKFT